LEGLLNRGKERAAAGSSCICRTREPVRLRPKPRRQTHETNGASGLAAGQPRKPKAALVVDWFYALPPYDWLPREGDRFNGPFLRKEPEDGLSPRLQSNYALIRDGSQYERFLDSWIGPLHAWIARNALLVCVRISQPFSVTRTVSSMRMPPHPST
jgi:hypothetical protein